MTISSDKRTGPLAALALLVLFAALALGTMQAWNILDNLEQVKKSATLEAQGRSRLAADYISNILDGAEQTLAALMLGQEQGLAPMSAMIERGVLFSSTLSGIALFNETGDYVAGFSRDGEHFQNCATCRFFRAHATEDKDFFIGSLLGDSDKEHASWPVLGVSRRLKDGQGAMMGVLAAFIDTAVIEARFAATSDLNVTGLSLIDQPGNLLALWTQTPGSKPRLLVHVPDFADFGLVRTEGDAQTIADKKRIIALHRTGAYPLWTALAFDPARLMDGWLKESRNDLIMLAGIFCILGVLTYAMARQMLERYRAEAALEASQTDLEKRVESRTLQLRREIQDRRRAEESLRGSEERFQRFMDNIPAAAFIKDEDGRYIYVNQHFSDIYGLKGREVIGRKVFDLFPAETLPRILADDLAVWREEKSISSEMDVVIEGRTRTFFFTKFPLRLAQGQKMLAGVVLDVTEQRATMKALAQAQKMEALGQLTGGIAHDFNNLLTIILGNLEMTEEFAAPGSDVALMAGEAKLAAKRGAALTERLLAMFRRRPRPGQASCEVNGLLLSISDLLRRTLGDAITIAIHPEDNDVTVPVDAGLLESAILNLALNARDAMPGGGSLTLSIQRRPEEQRAALLVADTGTGMSSEVLDRAFEPFFTTKEAGRGSGLGLSMVYSMAHQAGGSVQIDSEPGRGSLVTVLLPLADPAAAVAKESAPDLLVLSGDERILVVEDEAALARLAASMLSSLGYRVDTASNGVEALEMIGAMAEPPDLVFSDVMMPGGMDGFDLAACIGERHPGTAVLLASGHYATQKSEQETSAFTVLHKPYDKAALALHIRAQLDGRGS